MTSIFPMTVRYIVQPVRLDILLLNNLFCDISHMVFFYESYFVMTIKIKMRKTISFNIMIYIICLILKICLVNMKISYENCPLLPNA